MSAPSRTNTTSSDSMIAEPSPALCGAFSGVPGVYSYEFFIKMLSQLFIDEFDETGIGKQWQIRLCFGTAFLMKFWFIEKTCVYVEMLL